MESQNIYREVGQKIRHYRENARRTQAQLAVQIGISRASLANIEAGRQQVLVHYLYAIAAALDLDSPTALLATPSASASRDIESSALPLPEKGLTEKQRREVMRLMGGVLGNMSRNDIREDK